MLLYARQFWKIVYRQGRSKKGTVQVNNRTSKQILLGAVLCLSATACTPQARPTGAGKDVTVARPASRSLTPPRLQSHSDRPQDLLGINSVVVLPIEFSNRTRTLGPEGIGIDGQLEAAAQRELDLKLFGKSTFGKPLPQSLGRQDAVAWARRVGADAMLVTRLQNFIERSGSAVGGDPGTVHFEMTLVRLSDMRDVWSADYHFRDEALSDNIFRLAEKFDAESGPGWKRAQDVLEEGFSTALKDLAAKRYSQFSANG